MKIGVIRLPGVNLISLLCVLEKISSNEVEIIDKSEASLLGYDVVVFPGVGHFMAASNFLDIFGRNRLLEYIESGRRLVAICLGMQLFFESSEEGLGAGLGLIPGKVVLIGNGHRLPHSGWNQIHTTMKDPLIEKFNKQDFYFIHSYAYFSEGEDPSVLAKTEYDGITFVSCVKYKNSYGVQFHPEKSGPKGKDLLAHLLTDNFPNKI